MPLEPIVLLVPSSAAARELPRRLAMAAGAVAAVYPLKLIKARQLEGTSHGDLARAVAEPALLGAGLRPWQRGHDTLLVAKLLEGPHGLDLDPALRRTPVAAALARTFSALRMAGIDPQAIEALPAGAAATPEDAKRLSAVADLYRRFHDEVEGRSADLATVLREATRRLGEARWLAGAEILVVDDLELTPLEWELLRALARSFRVRVLERVRPPSLFAASFAARAAEVGIASVRWEQTTLARVAPPPPPEGLCRLRQRLFEPPTGEAVRDESVELVTAPGEAPEVRAIVRRLIREASRGVPFEDMGVAMPRPEPYATLFTDLLDRIAVPYRLHPSLPLRCGRCARSLLLLLRCRSLARGAVMEFLTFAPLRVSDLLGEGAQAHSARWDEASREAGVTSGYERWLIGLRAYADSLRREAEGIPEEDRRSRHLRRAEEAETLLRLIELMNLTLDRLSGVASWPEWSARLLAAFDQWIGPERDREAVTTLLADLAALGPPDQMAPLHQVEAVLEAQLEQELLPMREPATGGLHLGAFDAIAGLPFRVVAIPGLVEGGYPGTLRPDPFLLDAEREALNAPSKARTPVTGETRRERKGQLSLFDQDEDPPPPEATASATDRRPLLPTTQDRLLQERRRFHRAVSQATERLILSYPRADARTGRERMPSLFFVAAASTLAGRPLSAPELTSRVVEDDLAEVRLEETIDASERDRARVVRGGREAIAAIAAGAPFFKWSHLAAHARWSRDLTRFDGRVDALPPELARRLDPATAPRPVSASSLANYARCGFLYLLRNVLGLTPSVEPEERLWLDALEQGLLFHEVAEAFLRERRDRGELPVRDDEASRQRLLDVARERASRLVAGTPPRHRLVWEMRWRSFEDLLLRWLAREALTADRWTPAHFEVSFGSPRAERTNEPHSPEPLVIDVGDGRRLRVSGKIDRIDVSAEGALVLRDYKTGRAPKDDGGVFRGGRELQIPIYVLATRTLFPDRPVAEAFLDYVNGGRPVAFDPESVAGEDFRRLLRDMTDAIADGCFVQEPTSCKWCDFTAACGPQPLLEIRHRMKRNDPRVLRYLRLRDYR